MHIFSNLKKILKIFFLSVFFVFNFVFSEIPAEEVFQYFLENPEKIFETEVQEVFYSAQNSRYEISSLSKDNSNISYIFFAEEQSGEIFFLDGDGEKKYTGYTVTILQENSDNEDEDIEDKILDNLTDFEGVYNDQLGGNNKRNSFAENEDEVEKTLTPSEQLEEANKSLEDTDEDIKDLAIETLENYSSLKEFVQFKETLDEDEDGLSPNSGTDLYRDILEDYLASEDGKEKIQDLFEKSSVEDIEEFVDKFFIENPNLTNTEKENWIFYLEELKEVDEQREIRKAENFSAPEINEDGLSNFVEAGLKAVLSDSQEGRGSEEGDGQDPNCYKYDEKGNPVNDTSRGYERGLVKYDPVCDKNTKGFDGLIMTINAVTSFVTGIAIFLFVVTLIWAGGILMFQGSSTGGRDKAKKMINGAVIGIFFILGATFIVSSIFSVFGLEDEDLIEGSVEISQ